MIMITVFVSTAHNIGLHTILYISGASEILQWCNFAELNLKHNKSCEGKSHPVDLLINYYYYYYYYYYYFFIF